LDWLYVPNEFLSPGQAYIVAPVGEYSVLVQLFYVVGGELTTVGNPLVSVRVVTTTVSVGFIQQTTEAGLSYFAAITTVIANVFPFHVISITPRFGEYASMVFPNSSTYSIDQQQLTRHELKENELSSY
jgi:hypothetical protein